MSSVIVYIAFTYTYIQIQIFNSRFERPNAEIPRFLYPD